MVLGSIQTLTEMRTRHISEESKGRLAREADSFTAICKQTVEKYVGASTSHRPMGLLQG
jgi:hypothetical protein